MVITLVYALISLCLAVYSLHSLYLLWLYHRTKGAKPAPPAPAVWPLVTVQLPVYNEYTTLERLLNAVARLDYPLDHLEIQVLDDSTDETSILAAELIASLKRAGFNITHLRRDHRQGFKAGALAEGMLTAGGEFTAIFDADFVPPSDFLKRLLPYFADPQVGCVQSRWGHLNRDYSLLTRLQAMAIDGHFMVEQTARSRSGLFMNFNGSAGVWRSACILDSGGWQSGTLTEDFDLSYRAQLRGWRITYLPDLVVEAELPVQMAALKQQQARWARGSMQTARKLIGPLLKSQLPLHLKITGSLHLTHYIVHPLMLLAFFLAPWMRIHAGDIFQWLPVLMFTALIAPLLYLTSPAPEAPPWPQRLMHIPALMLLNLGMSYNNAQAALSGLFLRKEGVFLRTPKFAVQHSSERWEFTPYAISRNAPEAGEILVMLGAFIGIIISMGRGDFPILPWLFLYIAGYGLVAVISFSQFILSRMARAPGSNISDKS